MRRLHPLSPDERFVASGEHAALHGGVVERWSVHEQVGGALLIRMDRDSRPVDGRSLLAEMWCSAEGSAERFSLRAYGGPQDAFRLARVDAAIFAEGAEVGYSVDEEPRQDVVLSLSHPATVCPDGTVFRGLAIRWAVQTARPAVLVTHATYDDPCPFGAAALTVAGPPEHVETGSIAVDGRAVSGRRWRWPGAAGFEGDWWLDAHGAVLRYVRPDGDVQTLARYARRVEPVER
ncbi:MAG: hypothetical protein ACUVSX_08665 [Aggregatilineales bacterium]